MFVCGVFNVLAWTDTINFPPNNDLKKKSVYFIEHLLFQWFIRDKKFNLYFAMWAARVWLTTGNITNNLLCIVTWVFMFTFTSPVERQTLPIVQTCTKCFSSLVLIQSITKFSDDYYSKVQNDQLNKLWILYSPN